MLRDYQQDMLARLFEAWQQHRSVLVQMPTGTGKTILMAEVIKSLTPDPSIPSEARPPVASRGGEGSIYPRVLVVAHRRELIEQIRRSLPQPLQKEGSVVVESIQKLARADCKSSYSSESDFKSDSTETNSSLFTLHFSLIIVDEAHHALAKTYRMLWERWPEAKFLGLTATPCRLNGAAFTDLFDVMLQSWPIQTFIDKGWLSDFEYVSAAPGSWALRQISNFKKRGADGDYQTKEMVTVMDVPESIEHLYNTYKAFADGKKGIVYAIDRQHAQHIAEYYQAQGVSCAVIDSKTPAKERERLVKDYKEASTASPPTASPPAASPPTPLAEERGVYSLADSFSAQQWRGKKYLLPSPQREGAGVRLLINVDIFSEGFDCPEVEFIQLARPTLSLSKYLQQVGRGMRVSEGKPHVLILDNVGLYQTFGLPTDERDWMQTFLGRQAGKGQQQSRPLVVDMEDLMPDMSDCRSEYSIGLDCKSSSTGNTEGTALGGVRGASAHKVLVNLEMVRIKRRGERHEGVEVIVQEGKYGVMYNGTVTCQPRFVKIRPLKDGGEFFALADFPQDVMGGKTTVINNRGIDLQMALYGEVTRQGDFFLGRNRKGERCYWDGQGREYYKELPTFRNCGGVDLKPFMRGRYRLRRWPNLFVHGLSIEDVYSNKDLVIIDNQVLIVKTVPQRAYTIFGYKGDSVLVNTSRGMMEIRKDGTTGDIMKVMPKDFHQYPSYYSMNLQAVR